MRAGWIAPTVRGRLLLTRLLGREESLALAACPTLAAALDKLAASAYGERATGGATLEAAQHHVFASALWHLRVLAGWVPPRGAEAFRALTAWFELANIESRLAYLAGASSQPLFELGSLASAWPRIASAQSTADVRRELGHSIWGDPGADSIDALYAGLRRSWARRVLELVPETRRWVAGALAIAAARHLFVEARSGDEAMDGPFRLLGQDWKRATSLDDLAERVPAEAAWPLEGVDSALRLWEAEFAWWSGVAVEGRRLAFGQAGRSAVVGATALLCVDAWRVSAALELAARGGHADLVEDLARVA